LPSADWRLPIDALATGRLAIDELTSVDLASSADWQLTISVRVSIAADWQSPIQSTLGNPSIEHGNRPSVDRQAPIGNPSIDTRQSPVGNKKAAGSPAAFSSLHRK
jgi:hypothetical protein